jgi:hypothetical protein
MKKVVVVVIVLLVVAAGALAFVPVGGDDGTEAGPTAAGPAIELSGHSDGPPGTKLRLLFIHHSVGGMLLADQGERDTGEHAAQCIWDEHPNGGGLRSALARAGYEVHEASYGSRVGERTDLFDWLPKFRDQMDDVLRVDLQDRQLAGDLRNQIVVFKSCFPNSEFAAEGEAPGDPAGPELTVWNARASLTGLLEHFARHPDVLFVYVTAPPQAAPVAEPLWKWLARKVLGRGRDAAEARRSAALARQFNNWVRAPDGWLAGYPHRNVVVFDFFDVLTDHGRSNMLRYATGGGTDSHPSAAGTSRAAADFVPLLNRAVRRAGLVEEPQTR